MSRLRLTAIEHDLVRDFRRLHTGKLFELVAAFGSPLHLLFPDIVRENIDAYRAVFRSHNLQGDIFYAAKANKSEAVLEAVGGAGIGVDVSTLFEFRRALAHGIAGNLIGVSGPTKDRRLLLLAIQHGATITIDGLDDVQALLELSARLRMTSPIAILVRLNDAGERASRFGVPARNLSEIYDFAKHGSRGLALKGFAFHLDGYSILERVRALTGVFAELERARSFGSDPNIVSLGGGFTVSYVEAATWEAFHRESGSEDATSAFFGGKQFTKFYPYHSKLPKAAFLDAICESRVEGKSVAALAVERGIQFRIEPGRSLLDQVGITVMLIKGTKEVASGERIVQVEANINHLSEQWFNTEFLPDPLHVIRTRRAQPVAIEAAVGGNTCMEIDMLSWRKRLFEQEPQHGDLLAYLNTAGYQMDSNESEFHSLPVPEKIVAFRRDGEWLWKRDSQYSMLDAIQ